MIENDNIDLDKIRFKVGPQDQMSRSIKSTITY